MSEFKYNWTLKDANFTKDKGKVFSCFACGGGSTMGYKLSGFDVLGCNEIDPKMIEAYKANHNPKYAYLEPIQTFKNRKDLPKELYNLDYKPSPTKDCQKYIKSYNQKKFTKHIYTDSIIRGDYCSCLISILFNTNNIDGITLVDGASVDQLDLLWHDINNGILGDGAKESIWFNTIKEIKDNDKQKKRYN